MRQKIIWVVIIFCLIGIGFEALVWINYRATHSEAEPSPTPVRVTPVNPVGGPTLASNTAVPGAPLYLTPLAMTRTAQAVPNPMGQATVATNKGAP